MKSSTKDELKGKLHELKGTAKEKAGRATNNPKMEIEGGNERTAGKVQQKVGQIKKLFNK